MYKKKKKIFLINTKTPFRFRLRKKLRSFTKRGREKNAITF